MRAKHRITKKKVAVKIIDDSTMKKHGMIIREEVKLHMRLKHKNIVKI